MRYLKKLKKSTRRTRFLLALLTLLFGFSANAATYKVSDTPADVANLAEGAKVVMYNIGASKLVGYNNGEVYKTEKAVTDADQAAYVFTVVAKSGSSIELRNSTGFGPAPNWGPGVFFKWSTSPTFLNVSTDTGATQLYIYHPYVGGNTIYYLAFKNSEMTVTSSGNEDTSKWNLYEVTQETSGNAPTYKVSDTPADWANLAEGAKVVMYNIGAGKLVGYKNGEVSKTEKAVTDADYSAYVFTIVSKTVTASGTEIELRNGTGVGPSPDWWGGGFKWSTSLNFLRVSTDTGATQLYIYNNSAWGSSICYLAFENSKMTLTSSGNEDTSKWNFYEVTQETSGNAHTYKVSDTPADWANLAEGAKVVMYNIGAGKLVGYKNGEVSKTEKVVTDADYSAYVFTVVAKSGSSIELRNSTGFGPAPNWGPGVFFKWSTSPTFLNVSTDTGATQLYIYYPYVGGNTIYYLAFENSEMTLTSSGNEDTSKWNFYEVTQETSGSTGDGDATVHNQLKAWQTNAGYQEVGYIGLGNKNQVLAMACVSVSADDVPTLTYRLFGHTDYLSAISVYARKRDTKQDYTPDGDYAKYENTFAHIFDYRNPEKNCGALFLGTTHEVPAAGEETTFTSNLKLPEGEYVIYLVANVRSAEEIGGLENLPLIGGAKRNYTRVGGVIDQVSNKTINTVNNYSGEGGGRVLVPNFKMLYAPRYENFATSEEYSRYYRIPAITRASDGTLVALSDARKMHIHDVTNSIDVISRRSSDNGKTWSDYVVIFQGSQSGEDCYNWAGYGDAAVASFSNGTVVATAIHGFGLAGTRNDPATDVVWKVSRDNGKSWSSEYTMDRKLFGRLRGNISPGNICVANDGYLKGKALVGLRTSTSPNYNSRFSASHQRIYCLTYDPDKNTWTNVTTGRDNYIEVSGDLDETQFVQTGENEYLMSARYYGTGFRKFYRLTFTSETTATVTEVSQSGMTLAGGCNGDLIKYAAKDGTQYILHTVPKDMVYGSNNCRTSLSAYYTELSTSGDLNWTRSLNLFDPFDYTSGGAAKTGIGAMDETAQYSSLSMQEDGTIAVLMEAYPYAIRHKDKASSTYRRHWGDWVMGQYYINLRIGDIVDGAEQPDPVKIDAPVISPNSSTYDSYDPTARPTITISHQNYVNYPNNYNTTDKKVKTLYEFEYYDADGKRLAVSKISESEFTEETKTLTWQDVYKALGYTSDPTLKQNGYSVRVSAYCVSANDAQVISKKDVKIYTFANPVRNIKVIGLPTSGASKTELSTQGNTVGSDVWLTVGVGQEVHLNAPALYPFKFKGFYYKYKMNGAEDEQVTLSQKLTYNEVSGMQHQITFTVPSVEVLANNHKDGDDVGLVIYAVYDVEAGFSTRVNTQYNNGLVGDKYESQYSYWAPKQEATYIDRIVNAKGGDEFEKDLSLPVAPKQDNVFLGGNGKGDAGALTYPQALNYGLDAYVTLVPDSRAAKYLNAIIRVKKGNAYLQNYYVVNGANQALYGNITSAFNGCLGVVNWYAYSGGEFYPKAVGMKKYEVGSKPKATSARRSIVEGGANGAWYKVESDISFAGICEKAETFDGVVTVEIYLVNGDVTSVNELSNSNYYITKVSHTIVKDPDISTGVEDVDAEKTVAGVTYYNLLGVSSDRPFEGVNVVVTTYTDGTKSSKKILK